jgi:hypothetical protein
MKNKNIISPVGLKGKEINERMRELMGISSINENKSNIVVELTKMGPDGKAYAIIRENHEYYIKTTTKTSGLVAEDFKYIGGLQNKKEQAYPSYAKAIKHLNLRFNSLSEAFNSDEKINTFLDDNLLSESGNGFGGGFADMPKGGGFTGEGNLEGNSALYEEDEKDEEDYGTHINGSKLEKPAPIVEDEDLDEVHQAVDDMLKESWMEEELHGNQDKIDMNHNGEIDGQDFKILRGMDEEEDMGQKPMSDDELFDMIDNMTAADFMQFLKDAGSDIKRKVIQMISTGADKARNYLDNRYSENELYEGKLSINRAINQMDALIDGLSDQKKKVKTQQ